MPTRHKGIGMNRAKKKKVSPLVPVQNEAPDAEESEDDQPAAALEPGGSREACLMLAEREQLLCNARIVLREM